MGAQLCLPLCLNGPENRSPPTRAPPQPDRSDLGEGCYAEDVVLCQVVEMKLSPAGINTEIGPMWDTPETPWARGCDLAPTPGSPQGAVRAGQQVVEDIEGGFVGRALGDAQLLQQQRLMEVGELGTIPKGPAPTKTSPAHPSLILAACPGSPQRHESLPTRQGIV